MSDLSAWHESRAKGIGGSEVAAILGLSKFKTPYQVWADKRGLSGEKEESEPMKWGKILEPVIRQEYSNQTGRTVRLPGHLVDADCPVMIGTVDGITDDEGVLEIKTSKYAQDFGEPGTDECPQGYLLQVQQYMHITKLKWADIAVLIGGSDFRIYTVEADAELQEMMIERIIKFWAMVEAGEPPEPVSYADAVKRYRVSTSKAVVASPVSVAAYETLKCIKEQYKAIEQSEENAKMLIMKDMAEGDTLLDAEGRTLITWKSTKSSDKFNVKAFQVAHPELYKEFLETKEGYRRFLLK